MYKLLEEVSITACDVDNTLVMWDKDFKNPGPGKIEFDYGSEKVYLKPHNFHVTFLKHCCNRGDYVEVWSQNGYQWAEQVVKRLELENHVDIVRSKPSRHIDDKESLEDIVGNRIYIPDEN